MRTVLPVITIFAIIIISCSKSGSGGSGGGNTPLDCALVTNKAFTADVNPVIQSTCTGPGCHGSGSTNGPGELTTYNQIFSNRVSIRAAISSGLMPQGSSLPVSQKNSILCWIDSGAPNN